MGRRKCKEIIRPREVEAKWEAERGKRARSKGASAREQTKKAEQMMDCGTPIVYSHSFSGTAACAPAVAFAASPPASNPAPHTESQTLCHTPVTASKRARNEKRRAVSGSSVGAVSGERIRESA